MLLPPLLLLPSLSQCRVGDVVRATTAFTMQMTYPTMQLMFGGTAGRATRASMLPAGRSPLHVCCTTDRPVWRAPPQYASLYELFAFASRGACMSAYKSHMYVAAVLLCVCVPAQVAVPPA